MVLLIVFQDWKSANIMAAASFQQKCIIAEEKTCARIFYIKQVIDKCLS
jgi:hypothetical protein